MAGVSPVFFISGEQFLTNYEVCCAAEKEAGEVGSIVGAQAIGKLWRIYPANTTHRITLLMKGRLPIREEQYHLTGKNPFIVHDEGGEKVSTKLHIGNVPISFSNEEIERGLKRM